MLTLLVALLWFDLMNGFCVIKVIRFPTGQNTLMQNDSELTLQ